MDLGIPIPDSLLNSSRLRPKNPFANRFGVALIVTAYRCKIALVPPIECSSSRLSCIHPCYDLGVAPALGTSRFAALTLATDLKISNDDEMASSYRETTPRTLNSDLPMYWFPQPVGAAGCYRAFKVYSVAPLNPVDRIGKLLANLTGLISRRVRGMGSSIIR